MRPHLIALGGLIYIGGFLVLVYALGTEDPPIESWPLLEVMMGRSAPSPFEVPTGATLSPAQQVAASFSPRALPSAAPRAVSLAPPLTTSSSAPTRASAPSFTARANTVASKGPHAASSPCPKPIGAQPLPRVTPPVARPLTPSVAPQTRAIVPPSRDVKASSVELPGVSRPHARRSAEPPAAREEQQNPANSPVLLSVGKSSAVGVANELNPNAGPRGTLLINPVAAATPPTASAH